MAVKSAPPTTAPLPFPTVSVILLETEPALTNRTLESLKEQAYMPMEVLQTRGSNTAKAYKTKNRMFSMSTFQAKKA